MVRYDTLPAFAGDDIHVVVETARGMAQKLSYKPDLGLFAFSRPLPLGLVYLYDWGFIPSTCGEDGDPLDGLVIHDGASAPGVLIPCRLLGAVKVEQRENGKTLRNDRYLLRPAKAPRSADLTDATCLPQRTRKEIEQFFAASVMGTGKELNFAGWDGPGPALKALQHGAAAFAARKK
jgi:inorganic pyrophosphatase